jgi:hypothetical protein
LLASRARRACRSPLHDREKALLAELRAKLGVLERELEREEVP